MYFQYVTLLSVQIGAFIYEGYGKISKILQAKYWILFLWKETHWRKKHTRICSSIHKLYHHYIYVMAWLWTDQKPLPDLMRNQFIDAYMAHHALRVECYCSPAALLYVIAWKTRMLYHLIPFIFHDMQWMWLNFLENAYAPWITGTIEYYAIVQSTIPR